MLVENETCRALVLLQCFCVTFANRLEFRFKSNSLEGRVEIVRSQNDLPPLLLKIQEDQAHDRVTIQQGLTRASNIGGSDLMTELKPRVVHCVGRTLSRDGRNPVVLEACKRKHIREGFRVNGIQLTV